MRNECLRLIGADMQKDGLVIDFGVKQTPLTDKEVTKITTDAIEEFKEKLKDKRSFNMISERYVYIIAETVDGRVVKTPLPNEAAHTLYDKLVAAGAEVEIYKEEIK